MPFQIAILLIIIIGAIPLLFKADNILFFKDPQTKWKLTKVIESISDWLEEKTT